MIDAFVEGARSVVQVCHLVILLPVAMFVLAGRARWYLVAGAVGGILAGGWLFMTRWLVLDDAQIRWSSLLVIVGTVATAIWFARDAQTPSPGTNVWLAPVASVSAALVAIVVTAWWRPCVGTELGDLLTRAPDDPGGQLLPSLAFMLGISLPIVVIGLAIAAWEPSATILRNTSVATASIAVVLAGSVLVGQHGEIVARLFEWSQ